MFTGIVQQVGSVLALTRRGAGARLRVRCAAPPGRAVADGDSIAVNGCCLTVARTQPLRNRSVKDGGTAFDADLSAETLQRTTLGSLRRGARVNLETALRLGDALGGHMMQGHVEGVGRLRTLKRVPAAHARAARSGPGTANAGGWWIEVQLPAPLLRYVVEKGSIAIDGISLTVAALADDVAGFAIVPFTRTHTNLAFLQPGAAVNIETDPLAHYVDRLLANPSVPQASRLTGVLGELGRGALAVAARRGLTASARAASSTRRAR